MFKKCLKKLTYFWFRNIYLIQTAVISPWEVRAQNEAFSDSETDLPIDNPSLLLISLPSQQKDDDRRYGDIIRRGGKIFL
jgi:hypothetical protein